jgi:hypothetical protein
MNQARPSIYISAKNNQLMKQPMQPILPVDNSQRSILLHLPNITSPFIIWTGVKNLERKKVLDKAKISSALQ